MIYAIWQSAMERQERAEQLVNLREVTKKGYKRNLLDFEQGKGFLLRPHKSHKHKLDNNTSGIISRNTGNVTCVTIYEI